MQSHDVEAVGDGSGGDDAGRVTPSWAEVRFEVGPSDASPGFSVRASVRGGGFALDLAKMCSESVIGTYEDEGDFDDFDYPHTRSILAKLRDEFARSFPDVSWIELQAALCEFGMEEGS